MYGSARTRTLPPNPRLTLKNVRLLLVDDDADTRDALAAVLASHHSEVKVAGCAADAMATLRVWQPHVLVSDVSLPDVDGYALIRQVRALDRLAGGDIPAVALTGRGRREDRIRLLSAGFQIHLVKPVDLTELVQTIASLAAYAAPGADAVIAAPVPSADATAETPDATSTDTSVGHELRQPLFAMGLWLNLLESEIGETQTAEARAHVAQLRASIAAMEDIVRRRLDEKS